MDDLYPVFATAAVILVYFLFKAVNGSFDPFAPMWLFFVGYIHVYVVQALTYHEWAVGVRGKELVWAANLPALWALVWFLSFTICRSAGCWPRALPAAARDWSPRLVATISPPLLSGAFSARACWSARQSNEPTSNEVSLVAAFPFVMMVAAVLLDRHRPDAHSSRPHSCRRAFWYRCAMS